MRALRSQYGRLDRVQSVVEKARGKSHALRILGELFGKAVVLACLGNRRVNGFHNRKNPDRVVLSSKEAER